MLLAATVLACLPGPAAADACPNEARRIEQGSTYLPDCRAFELVSPPGSSPSLLGEGHQPIAARAAAGGNGIGWFSRYPIPGSPGGSFYDLSSRSEHGWATKSVGPSLTAGDSTLAYCKPAVYFSTELTNAVISDGIRSSGLNQGGDAETCGHNEPSLVAEEPEGFQNVFLEDPATGIYSLVNRTQASQTPADAFFQGGSEDLSHSVFEESAQLTAEAPQGSSLYETVGGVVHLVSVLPDGTPSTGVIPGAVNAGKPDRQDSAIVHSIASDGTRVIFEHEGGGGLYLREHPEQPQSAIDAEGRCSEATKACTLQLDASEVGGPGGGGSFLAADAADDRIFFIDGAQADLTAGTLENSGEHLYEFNTETQRLADLTPAGEPGVQGFTGVSSDGSYLYAVATAVLAEGATAGAPNLYLFHSGEIRYVATLEGGSTQESFNWRATHLTARVSSNGRYLAFDSARPLTGYDNTPAEPGDCLLSDVPSGRCAEIFLYDATTSKLACVSCGPVGQAPTAISELQEGEEVSGNPWPEYLPRNLSDDGRVLFDTATPLGLGVSDDNVSHVYEYAAGHVTLLSSPDATSSSYFYDASENGQDVFIVASQPLVSGDLGNGLRLYDVRLDGGLPEQDRLHPPCSGEDGCRGAAGAPTEVGPSKPATSVTQGSGNLPVTSTTTKPPTRKHQLERALRACRHDKQRRRRAACIRRAQARYGAHSSKRRRTR